MSPHDYSYCLLRYRRDPDAGEFANIGVVLWSPQTSFLGFQACTRYERLIQFFGAFDTLGYSQLIPALEHQFEILARNLERHASHGEQAASVLEFASRVVPIDDGALVWSAVRGGLTQNPKVELLRLYERYVGALNRRNEEVPPLPFATVPVQI